MRSLRDDWMQVHCPEDIETYYQLAPRIVQAVQGSDQSQHVWEMVFLDCIEPCMELVHEGAHSQAYLVYKRIFGDLIRRYL